MHLDNETIDGIISAQIDFAQTYLRKDVYLEMIEMERTMLLGNQLCFYLYAGSRAITRYYHPYIERMGLTYPQWLTMLVLWEDGEINVKALGEKLYLDSGTLTPMLKRLEEKGYINRRRSKIDERRLNISLTEEGKALQEKIYPVFRDMHSFIPIDDKETEDMLRILKKGLDSLAAETDRRDGKK